MAGLSSGEQNEWSGEKFLKRCLGSWHGAQNKGWHFPTFHCAVIGCKDFFLYPQGWSVPSRRETKVRGHDTIPPRSGARTYRGTASHNVLQGHCVSLGVGGGRALSLGNPLNSQSRLFYCDPLKKDRWTTMLSRPVAGRDLVQYLFLTPSLAAPVRISFSLVHSVSGETEKGMSGVGWERLDLQGVTGSH